MIDFIRENYWTVYK